ncbi:unnamed protein product [Rhizophagus irregularis]|uniref:Uncharacterized protein n=1 Tax=Rhizophagus irregularis TaxID=588596 RepID=A0A915YYT8_9GLOM|nr:unnamed protein product [Rhizophagus irregularis]CAB5212262.1 unnamed protein product [Rhizophagus irregularis]CAB5352885.1 unnamed protein product [Rhizophagus irregularis]
MVQQQHFRHDYKKRKHKKKTQSKSRPQLRTLQQYTNEQIAKDTYASDENSNHPQIKQRKTEDTTELTEDILPSHPLSSENAILLKYQIDHVINRSNNPQTPEVTKTFINVTKTERHTNKLQELIRMVKT